MTDFHRLQIHVEIQHDRDVFRRTGQIFRVVGRKVSETLSGRRLSSVPDGRV
jgi:hypothetical protein